MCTGLVAAAALASAAASVGGTAASIANAGNDRGAGAAVARSQKTADADRIAQYALAREAQRRGTAGTRDSEGNTTSYNEAGNFWESKLGPADEAVKGSSDSAIIRRNTIDAPMATQANIQGATNDAFRQRGQNAAYNDLSTYTPPTREEGVANAQQDTITANREATRPIIADTARTFARQGTASGPILSTVQRSAADTLRRGLQRDRAAGDAGGGATDGRQQALARRVAAYSGRAPMEVPNIAPSTAPNLGALIASRAANNGELAARAAGGIPQSTYANNQAASLGAKYGGPDNTLASSIFAGGNSLATAIKMWQDAQEQSKLPGTVPGSFTGGAKAGIASQIPTVSLGGYDPTGTYWIGR